MRDKYLAYALVVALLCSAASWSNLAGRATGGRGSGNSWHSWTSGSGYSGGGWASGGGGGHK
jgi:uncharacterized membrane protein YgcG